MKHLLGIFVIGLFAFTGCVNTFEGAKKDTNAGWEKTKEVSSDAWKKTKEVSSDVYDATKNGVKKITE